MREKVKDKGRLEHILESIDYVIEFTNEVDLDFFLMNKMLQFAVVKNLEIVGEASYRLTNEFRNSHPEIEWNSIISMRHILVHGYYDTNLMIVWDTVKNYLPSLKEQIQTIYDNEHI